jgi:hypothetical protein
MAGDSVSDAYSLVENHVIHARVIVPGACHLEFVHALATEQGLSLQLVGVSFPFPLLLPSQDHNTTVVYACKITKVPCKVRQTCLCETNG